MLKPIPGIKRLPSLVEIPQYDILIKDMERLLTYIKVGQREKKKVKVLMEWYKTKPGDMWENRKTGKQFIIIGCSACNQLIGRGLNHEHIGFYDNTNCKPITYKNIGK